MIKRWYKAAQPRLGPIAWAALGGLTGAGIGLMAATLWIWSRGAVRP